MEAEGFRAKPYLDCCGKYWRECRCKDKGALTIGWGRNLDDVGITKLEAEVLLDHNLADAEQECRRAFEWFEALNHPRQRVVTEIVFNIGLPRFLGFYKAIDAIAARDYATAAAELLASKWANQVKGRAIRLAAVMRDGRP